MGPARIYPWRKMHRSRVPSIAPGTFFVAQSWADCITNMPGFNLRQAQANGYSVIYIGWGEQVRAALALDDSVLPEARSTVEALRSRGLHVQLLSGDLAHATQRVAVAAGIQDAQSGLSPEAKRAALRQLRQKYNG